MALKVVFDYIPLGHPNRPGTKLYSQDARIWHGTANTSPTATDEMHRKYAGRPYIKKWNEETKSYKFYEQDGITPFVYGATHNYIDKDSVTIIIPHDEYAPGAGDKSLNMNNGYNGQTRIARDVFNYQQNFRTIQTELCMNDMNAWDKVLSNAIEFTKLYMPHIKKDFRHFDVTGKPCPAPLVNTSIKEVDPRWLQFVSRINAAIASLNYPADTPKIRVNGEILNGKMDVQPFIKDGRTFVPVRFIAEALGKKVVWIPSENIVDIY
ncbi:MAG TPA: stalk domain-containing protein [Pseudobacteroides sp.]|uniref:stalk domain-containing protein n=1 Tax=Pseudobacteroides sp. TaxID=1968840 RepID=UPI002F93EC5F